MGAVAEHAGISFALVGAAIGLVIRFSAMWRYPLQMGGELDLTPSMHQLAPAVVVEPPTEQGPILVTVEYSINSTRAADFTRVIQAGYRQRLRDDARCWSCSPTGLIRAVMSG